MVRILSPAICRAHLGTLCFTVGFATSNVAANEASKSLSYRPQTPPESRLAYQPLEVAPHSRATFLKGRIVDEKGQPIAGAKVDVYHWYPGTEVKTDKSGAFHLFNSNPKQPVFAPDEKVEVTFSAPGYTPRYIAAQTLGQLTQPVVLTKDTFIFGVVRDQNGQPVAGAKVRAVSGPFEGDGVSITEVPYRTTTDAQGRYKLFLQGDKYELFVLGSKGNSRIPDVTLSQEASLQKEIALRPGSTFRARVVDSVTGRPIPGFRLMSQSDFNAVSDRNGVIRISNMYQGPFQWDVNAPGVARWWSEAAIHPHERKSYGGDKQWQRNLDSLSFQIAPNMAPVTIVAERGVRIQGRVLDPNGKPVAGATVAPALTGTGNSLTGDTRFSVLTNSKGEFSGLYPAGHARQWNLIAHDGDYGKWRRWANVSSAPLKTAAGQVIKNFTLTLNQPVVVTGRVVDKSGQSVAHAEVRAVQADKRANRYYDPTVETDSKGRFTLRFVSPGRHYIQVAPFWLKAEEAPTPSTKIIEAKVGKAVDVGTLTQVSSR